MNRSLLFIIALMSIAASCRKQEVGPQCPSCEGEFSSNVREVVIGCEGNFGWGNASISVYNPENNAVSNQVFNNVNGFGVGDVLQSITLINNELFVVVNNSNEIKVLDTSNYQINRILTCSGSPRNILKINNSKAFVSDLYNDSIMILDYNSGQELGQIATDRWVEKMYNINGQVWALTPDTNFVFIVDPSIDQIVDTIVVGQSPNGIKIDVNGKAWVLSSGGNQNELATLSRINPITRTIEATFTFNQLSDSPRLLDINAQRDALYFVNEDLYKMDISASSLPSASITSSNGSIFYGMNLDTLSNEIYLTDAVDYVQPGKVFRIDENGISLDTFTVGIIPQAIWFK